MQERHMNEKASKYLSGAEPDPRIQPPFQNTRGAGEKRSDVSRAIAAADSQAMPYVVGESTRMREIYTIIRKAAPWDANVCIEGENGTGKELVARAVHFSGPRRDHPFVTLDCSTIAEGLIERHRFG